MVKSTENKLQSP